MAKSMKKLSAAIKDKSSKGVKKVKKVVASAKEPAAAASAKVKKVVASAQEPAAAARDWGNKERSKTKMLNKKFLKALSKTNDDDRSTYKALSLEQKKHFMASAY